MNRRQIPPSAQSGMTLVELVMASALLILVAVWAHDWYLRGMQLMAASDARKESIQGMRSLGHRLDKEFAMATVDASVLAEHVFSTSPLIRIKYLHLDSAGVESQRMVVYDTVCAFTVDSAISGSGVSVQIPLLNLPCVQGTHCAWATQTLAVRRRAYHGWNMQPDSLQGTRCFPDNFAVSESGGCVARTTVYNRSQQLQGAALCASAPASHAGAKAYVQLSSFFLGESGKVIGLDHEVSLVRTHGHADLTYIDVQ